MLDELRGTPEVLYGAAIALLVVVLLTPAVGGMARLLGVVDEPDGRRLNRRPIPRLGGIAIFLGIVVPSLAFLDLSGEMRGILLGAAVACVVGAVDDFRGLAPVPKLAGQVLAASIPVAFGTWIDHFTLPFVGAVDLPAGVGVPLTIFWIVAVMNMVNFLDGMDGLASGVCAISGVTFAVISLSLGKPDAAVLSAIVAGACVGFLRHNFFPARIFMGDSGALVLGFTLASISVAGLLKTASTVVLFLPLLVLAVPIIDTSFVVAKRLKYRRPISGADRSHLHHRFVDIGFSQRRAALTMWAWTATLGAAALATRFIPFREGGEWHPAETIAVAAIALAALAFSVYIVYLLEIVKLANPRIRARRQAGAHDDRPPTRDRSGAAPETACDTVSQALLVATRPGYRRRSAGWAPAPFARDSGSLRLPGERPLDQFVHRMHGRAGRRKDIRDEIQATRQVANPPLAMYETPDLLVARPADPDQLRQVARATPDLGDRNIAAVESADGSHERPRGSGRRRGHLTSVTATPCRVRAVFVPALCRGSAPRFLVTLCHKCRAAAARGVAAGGSRRDRPWERGPVGVGRRGCSVRLRRVNRRRRHGASALARSTKSASTSLNAGCRCAAWP